MHFCLNRNKNPDRNLVEEEWSNTKIYNADMQSVRFKEHFRYKERYELMLHAQYIPVNNKKYSF